MDEHQPYFEDIEEGAEIAPLQRTATKTQLFQFSAVTRNGHRIHYDREYAERDRLPDVLVQGPLQGAQLAAFVTTWMGRQGFLKRFAYSSRGIALPGEPLTLKGRIARKYEQHGRYAIDLEVWEEDAQGKVRVPGRATIYLPSRTGQS